MAVSFLAKKIIPAEDAAFVIDHYLPELKKAVINITIAHDDARDLSYRFVGMLIKIGWAFVWQEFFIPLGFLYNPIFNNLGAMATPDINEFAAHISNVPQTDINVNKSQNVYPGDSQCRGYSPHALWHEESANGLLEIVFLGDFMHKILSKTKDNHPEMFVM